MALVIADRVKETSTTTGTGTFTLGGAVTGFQPFSVIGNGNQCYYTIVGIAVGAEWEVGVGTYSSSTITRDTVLDSSAGGAKVSFSAGTKEVFVTYPAKKAVLLDANNSLFPANNLPTVISTNSSSDALRITQVGSGNALLVEDSANPDATPFVINADGAVYTGATSVAAGLAPAGFNVVGNNTFNNAKIVRVTDNDAQPQLLFTKARGTSAASPTASLSGDGAGLIIFQGYDGTNAITAAEVRATVDGTPGTNDMPGRLVFSTTADGASSPTERVRIDSAGNVGIGTTSPTYKLSVGFNDNGFYSDGDAFHVVQNTSNLDVLSLESTGKIHYRSDDNNDTGETGHLFFCDNTERMRIDSAGRVGIGDIPSNARFRISGETDQQFSVRLTTKSSSTQPIGFSTRDFGTAADVTATDLSHFLADGNSAIGSGSSLTSQYGFFVSSNLNGATNNYGFYGNIASGTGRWNFYANGTADNYFAGNVGIGVTNPSFKLHVVSSTDGELLRVQRTGGTNIPIFNVTLNEASATAQIGATGANPTSLLFATGGAERGRVSGTGVWSLGAAPGAESLRVTPVASAVNYVEVLGASTGVSPVLQAVGSDTNVNAVFATKGTGAHLFRTNGNTANTQFLVANTASAVNYLQVTGAATGSPPSMSAVGSDTNINLRLFSKGSGTVELYPNGLRSIRALGVTSAVNYIDFTNSVTGNPVQVSANGTDTNVDLRLIGKGTGVVRDANGNIRAVPKSGASKTSSYSLVKADVGQFIEIDTGGSITIPDATFAAGDILSLFNNTTGDITVTCTITTAYIGGTDEDKATVTLATRGVATILFISGTVCVINGNVS